jgi:hypothetical protein
MLIVLFISLLSDRLFNLGGLKAPLDSDPMVDSRIVAADIICSNGKRRREKNSFN